MAVSAPAAPPPLTFISGGPGDLSCSPTVTYAVHVVHPGALPGRLYRALADALPPGAAVSVLDVGCVPEYWQAALTGRQMDLTVVEIATQLRELSDQLNPSELPLTLVGWSFGGVIAYEMLLQSSGRRRPVRLVLLDSIAPVPGYQDADGELSADLIFDWFGMYLGAKRDRELAPVPIPAAAGLDERLGLLLAEAVRSGALDAGTALAGLRKVWDVYTQGLVRNSRLSQGYQPEAVAHPAVLVRAERGLLQVPEPLGWEQLIVNGLEVVTCPGNHYTMLTTPEAVSFLASILTAPAGIGAAGSLANHHLPE